MLPISTTAKVFRLPKNMMFETTRELQGNPKHAGRFVKPAAWKNGLRQRPAMIRPGACY